MRMLLKAQFEAEASNRAIKDGSLPKAIETFIETYKPEGVWFAGLDGKRTMLAVFDLASPDQLPPLSEPFFSAANASVLMTPAMDLADLRKGLASL